MPKYVLKPPTVTFVQVGEGEAAADDLAAALKAGYPDLNVEVYEMAPHPFAAGQRLRVIVSQFVPVMTEVIPGMWVGVSRIAEAPYLQFAQFSGSPEDNGYELAPEPEVTEPE
jgi:hypothetical protein